MVRKLSNYNKWESVKSVLFNLGRLKAKYRYVSHKEPVSALKAHRLNFWLMSFEILFG